MVPGRRNCDEDERMHMFFALLECSCLWFCVLMCMLRMEPGVTLVCPPSLRCTLNSTFSSDVNACWESPPPWSLPWSPSNALFLTPIPTPNPHRALRFPACAQHTPIILCVMLQHDYWWGGWSSYMTKYSLTKTPLVYGSFYYHSALETRVVAYPKWARRTLKEFRVMSIK